MIKQERKFNYLEICKWIIPRLVKGIPTTHEDAINAGLGHRLATSVHTLRKRGFYEVIETDFKNRCYYIPSSLRNKARKLAKSLNFKV